MKEWKPVKHIHLSYRESFISAVEVLLLINSRLAILPKECLFEIIGFCKFDWFEQEELTSEEMFSVDGGLKDSSRRIAWGWGIALRGSDGRSYRDLLQDHFSQHRLAVRRYRQGQGLQ